MSLLGSPRRRHSLSRPASNINPNENQEGSRNENQGQGGDENQDRDQNQNQDRSQNENQNQIERALSLASAEQQTRTMTSKRRAIALVLYLSNTSELQIQLNRTMNEFWVTIELHRGQLLKMRSECWKGLETYSHVYPRYTRANIPSKSQENHVRGSYHRPFLV